MYCIKDIKNKIVSLIKRAYITFVGNDDEQFQVTQINYLNKTTNMEVINPYGLCSNPPRNSLVLLFNVQGQEENRAGIANLPQQRFKNLKEGEVALGNYLTKTVIKFSENGDLEIFSASNCNVNVTGTTNLVSPQTNITGEIQVNGNINVTGDVVASGISLVNHIHGGVEPGGGTTSGPI